MGRSTHARWGGLIDVLAAPWNAAGLLTGAKSFEANPILGSSRLNERGLHAARVTLAHKLAQRRRAQLAHLISAEDRVVFERDGFVVKHDVLPAAEFQALARQLEAFRTDAREARQGDTLHRKIPLDRRMMAAVPALKALVRSPQWRGLIRYVGSIDSDPMVFLQSLFRSGGEQSTDPQTRLHADTFHPTVKAWFFLTDVTGDAGPFSYVPGSHVLTPERLDWERRRSIEARRSPDRETREGSFRIDRRELAALGLGEARTFAVKANTLLVADTFGFHARGPSAEPSRRVELFAYGKRSPFRLSARPDLRRTIALGEWSRWSWRAAEAGRRIGLVRKRTGLRRGVTAFEPPQDLG